MVSDFEINEDGIAVQPNTPNDKKMGIVPPPNSLNDKNKKDEEQAEENLRVEPKKPKK
jgi:hypothetical protein